MNTENRIRRGQSCSIDTRKAVREFYDSVAQEDTALVLFFCSSEFDRDALTDEMNRLFAGVPVVGCTSAGEIGPEGYRDHSITGMSFPATAFSAVVASMEDLAHFSMSEGQALSRKLIQDLETSTHAVGPDTSFAFLMVDGLSIREEQVARALQNGLGKIRLFGGSAGDDSKYERTWVFYDGAFHANAAALILIRTNLPFTLFRTQHFVCNDERLVVTEANAALRVVKEINGLPAAAEYARAIGVPVKELRPAIFAVFPVVVIIEGKEYVRSIQKTNADGSLTFFSAIDQGLVLRISHGVDFLANLKTAFADIQNRIGRPQLIIACDCILRRQEIAQNGFIETVADIMRRSEVVGFNTYGEQIDGVHMNQTLTGIALGYPRG